MSSSRILLSISAAMALVACSGGSQNSDSSSEAGSAPAASTQIVTIDGSSTVFPITEAVAEEYQRASGARVTIGVSGTGGGFKKFCGGETDITGASRPIKPSEVTLCGDKGIEYIELPVAYDGIAIVVNNDNDWVDYITTDELKMMWAPEAQAKVMKWSDVRAGWPDEELRLFGPGVDSGTYDYFTKAIVGKEHASRGDFTSSEDDNVLVQGVSTDRLALGFFGIAYYTENASRLKIVPVKHGDAEPVAASVAAVGDGSYKPLSRPIFAYVSKAAAQRPEVSGLVDFWVASEGSALATEVGYVGLPESTSKLVGDRFSARTTGSIFGGKGSTVGVSLDDLLGGTAQ